MARTPSPADVEDSSGEDSSWEGFAVGGDPAGTPVAVGGDLRPATLVGAYRRGLFPWPAADPAIVRELSDLYGEAVLRGDIPNLTPDRPPTLELPWWSPDPRGVIPVDRVHVSRSLRARLRSSGWTTTLSACFGEVMRRCRREPLSWISDRMVAAYGELHALGWAHSIEVWDGDELIGGMYGVLVGGVFTGESMFHGRTDASKVALVDFAARLGEGGGALIDTQFPSDHLATLGAVGMPRREFLRVLDEIGGASVRPVVDPLPVARLVAG